MADLSSSLQYAQGVRDATIRLCNGINLPTSDLRLTLLHAYVSVEIEHQEAILVLIEARLFGSAFSLIRIQLETAVRALWSYGLATDEQLSALEQDDNRRLPHFKDMLDQVDVAYKADEFFSMFKEAWSAYNGFTHSGVHQLSHRFSSNDVMPNYSDDEIASILSTSASLSVALLWMYFNIIRAPEKANELIHLLDSLFTDPSPFA